MKDVYKLPRLFLSSPLSGGCEVRLEGPQHHYLKNVLRQDAGDHVRIFNGREGEYMAHIEKADKKSLLLLVGEPLKAQPPAPRKRHLIFAPIKKERMEWMVEKAVELGATDLHPLFTQNTDIRKFNEERLSSQIIEAAEQCERLDIPALHPAIELKALLKRWPAAIPLLAAIERFNAPRLCDLPAQGDCGFLIGPAGGFSAEEKELIAGYDFVRPVSLGENILRAETAALAGLSILSR